MKLKICVGTPCHLMGAQNLISAAEEIKETEEIDLDIETVTCLDRCNNAPAIELAGQIYTPSTPQELIELIKSEIK